MRRGLLALALALGAPRALAQAPGEAAALLREGVQLRAARRDAEALAAFERAWERCRCDEATAQRALAEQALGRWGEAAEHLDAIAGSQDAWIARYRDALAGARALIARHVGVVELRVGAPEARVFVAGRPRGTVAGGFRRLVVDADEVVLRVEAPGRPGESRAVQVAPGAVMRVAMMHDPTPAPPSMTVEAPRTPPVAQRTTAPLARSPWVWVGAGGAALALTGGGLALAWRNEAITRFNHPSCVTVFASREENCGGLRRAGEVYEALAVTGFVLGGVGVAVAVGLALRDRASPRAWRCAPTGAAAVGCSVAF